MQFTGTVVLSAVAAAVAGSVGAFAWRNRRATGATALATFMLGSAIWAGGNAAQVGATSLGWKLFWIKVQFLGVPLIPVGVVWFACEYTDRDGWLSRPRLVALGAPLAAVTVLAWTNAHHHLLWSGAELATDAGVVRVDGDWGPAFWFAWVYSQLCNLPATGLLLFGVYTSGSVFRRQGLAIVAGALVPWVAHLTFLVGETSVDPIVFSAATGLAFAYAIASHGLLDLVPVARSVVVRDLEDGVLVVDDDGRLLDANPTAREALGLDANSLGEPVERALADYPALARLCCVGEGGDGRTLADGAGSGPADLLSVQRDGEVRHFDAQASTLGGNDGTAVVLRDVTGRRRSEAALRRQNERLARVGDAMAHDLRNPLTVARGYLDLARADDPEGLDEIEGALERMDEIVEETLAIARGGDPDAHDPVRLEAVARDAWQVVETGDAELVVEDTGTLEADRAQLQQLLENLFRNAVEHGSTSTDSHARRDAVEHGSTSPRSQGREDATERRSAGPDADPDDAITVTVEGTDNGFAVADDGRGVPAADRERIFERGYTTAEGGTGIGLATVETIAAIHGWRATVEESADGGARFAFRADDGEEAPPSIDVDPAAT